MRSFSHFYAILAIAAAVCMSAVAKWSMASAQQAAPSQEVERGKYLANEVAKCTECHTPRDKNNQLDPDRWLQGAPIWIKPVMETHNWADSAPRLAGLSNYTDAQVERVLEKGEGVTGLPILPPMHIYHMRPEDARAIIAYLRSLNGSEGIQKP